MKRLTRKDADNLRNVLIYAQKFKCALCREPLEGKTACLDHDHRTGVIREVLCLNCNGIEGKVFNLCRRAKRNRTEREFLTALGDYWDMHANPEGTLYIHPAHRTADEKRLARNAKARKRRAAKK